MTFAEIRRVEKLKARVIQLNGIIERNIERRDKAQGALDELMANHTLDKERLRKNMELYQARIAKLELLLEE